MWNFFSIKKLQQRKVIQIDDNHKMWLYGPQDSNIARGYSIPFLEICHHLETSNVTYMLTSPTARPIFLEFNQSLVKRLTNFIVSINLNPCRVHITLLTGRKIKYNSESESEYDSIYCLSDVVNVQLTYIKDVGYNVLEGFEFRKGDLFVVVDTCLTPGHRYYSVNIWNFEGSIDQHEWFWCKDQYTLGKVIEKTHVSHCITSYKYFNSIGYTNVERDSIVPQYQNCNFGPIEKQYEKEHDYVYAVFEIRKCDRTLCVY